jgi:PAS domain S-box-containing protein
MREEQGSLVMQTSGSGPGVEATGGVDSLHAKPIRGLAPQHILGITIGGIFIAEIVAMIVISLLPAVPYPVVTLIDATIMTLLIFPVVYVLTFRRLLIQVENEREISAALRRAYGQRQELETIVNRSPAVALIWGASEGWPVEFVSQNITQFGYTVEELIGAGAFSEIMVQEDRERVAREIAEYQEVGVTTFGVQYRIVTKGGDLRWVDGRAWVRRNPNDVVTHYYGIILDITEQKEAEQHVAREREKLKNILDAMRDGVYIVDGAFKLEYVNPVIEEEFGPPTGRKCYEHLHERDTTCPWCTQQEVRQGMTMSREWTSAKTGRTYDLLDTPLRNADGSVSMLKTLRDITKRKQYEQQLEQTNRELQRIAQVEQEQRKLAEALSAATLSVSQSLDLNEVLSRLLAAIRSAVPFDRAAILLFEGEEVMALRHPAGEIENGAAATSDEAALFFEQYPIMANVREIHEPRLVGKAGTSHCHEAEVASPSPCCYMVAPLGRQQPTGAIFLAREETGCFTEADLQRLVNFTSHAGIAVNNARLFARKVKARQTAEALREASAALSRSLDLDVVVDTSLDYIHRLVPYDGAEVVLLGSEGNLILRGQRGDWPWSGTGESEHGRFAVEDLPDVVELIEHRTTLVIEDTRTHPRWLPVAGEDRALSLLIVPLVAGGKAIGLYALHKNTVNFFTAEHVDLAEALAGLAAVAVHNAWLFEQVRQGSERLQTLSRRLVEIQESERLYVARELHDETGQALTSLMVLLRRIEQDAVQPELVRAHVADMDDSLQGVIENLHRLAMSLRPAALDHLGLDAAVRQNAETLADRYGLAVKVEPFGLATRLPRNVETILYRIVQEALTNVVRHAAASRVDVVMQTRDDKVIVIVEDDGVGFEPAELLASDHIGLLGMRERAETLGGSLMVESSPGKGTTILAEVPYDGPRSGRG